MANIVTNQAAINLLSTEDSTNLTIVNRAVSPTLDGFVADWVAYAKAPDNLIHALTFPGSFTTVNHVYIRNNAASGSLLVTITPSGGAAVSGCNLGPSDVFLYWMNSTTGVVVSGVTQGFTAISLTASAAGVTYEYFLGA